MPIAKKQPKTRVTKSTVEKLRGLLSDGTVVQLPLVKGNHRRAEGVAYNGTLYPYSFPEIPTSSQHERGPLVYHDQTQFLGIEDKPAESWIRQAKHFMSGDRSSLHEPLRSFADACASAQYPMLPDRVSDPLLPTDPPTDITCWMLRGVKTTKPMLLTQEQRQQAIIAGFWMQYPFVPKDTMIHAANALHYYEEVGYRICARHLNLGRKPHATN